MNSKTVHDVPFAMERVGEFFASIYEKGIIPTLYIPGNAGRIDALESWIFQNTELLIHGRSLHVFQTLALGSSDGWANAVTKGVIPVTPFIGPGVRNLVNKGLARNIRVNLSQVSKLFENHWRPDVAFAHVSPPDNLGRVTLGLNAGLDISAVKNAKYKIAVINKRMPRWAIGKHYDNLSHRTIEYGCAMKLSDFNFVVYNDEPLFEHTMKPKGYDLEASTAIAKNITDLLLRDIDIPSTSLPHTLQLGIGMIPNALASMLAEKDMSVKGMWSEMFSDGVLELYKKGLIRSKGGEYLRDHIVVGFVLGSKELYEAMRENPDFAVLPQEIVNDPSMISLNPYMVSVNAALAVSVHGEVVASTIGTKLHSDVGGQYDFAYGASCSKGGVAIIALPSTAHLRDGSLQSRVVSTHEEGSHHTISADLPVVVITEGGVADLRYLDDTARVKFMLELAHADWKPVLEKEVRQLPSMQGVGVIPARMVNLSGGEKAIVRPATALDIPDIKTYITQLSSEDRYTRYMGSVNVAVLVSDKRMEKWYDSSLDFGNHASFLMESEQGSIIGVVHAFQTDDESFEISFSRRSDQKGEGIGVHLMNILIDWADFEKVERLHAVTYRSNNPRMRSLFKKFGFVPFNDPDEPLNVKYSALVKDLVLVRGKL